MLVAADGTKKSGQRDSETASWRSFRIEDAGYFQQLDRLEAGLPWRFLSAPLVAPIDAQLHCY
jgi:hypothetical protein